MAEVVAAAIAEEEGVDADFSSDGVSDEEHGNPMDPRAERVLVDHGYTRTRHRARQLDAAMLAGVHLVVAAEQYHLDRLTRLGIQLPRTALITDFDVESGPGAPLPDPWYGGREDFEETLAVLERALPTLVGGLAQGDAWGEGAPTSSAPTPLG